MHIQQTGRFQRFDTGRMHNEGVDLVTIDLEKVLTDFGGTQLYSGAIDQLCGLNDLGIAVAIATNCHDTDRLQNIDRQLSLAVSQTVPIYYKGMKSSDGSTMRGKPAPDMLRQAKRDLFQRDSRVTAWHVDDQLKGGLSAKKADFDGFLWTLPDGNIFKEHPGVLLFRLVELPVGTLSFAVTNTFRTIQDVRRGDW